MNAVRHGLLAKTLLLGNESRETFELLLSQYVDRIGPRDSLEHTMVEDMVAACWRTRRGMAIETALIDDRLRSQPPGEQSLRLATAFSALAGSPELALLNRYEARLHRVFQRALANLYLPRNGGLDPRIGSLNAFLPNEPSSGNEHSDQPPLPVTAAPVPIPLQTAEALRHESEGTLSVPERGM